MSYIGWHDLNFGTLNVYDGECDIARSLLVWVGVPVAFVYRGAFHRISPRRVKDPRHLARLRQFLCDYFRWSPEQARRHQQVVDIPLKRRRALGWMTGLNLLVCLAGLGAIAATLMALVILAKGGLGKGDLLLLATAGATVAAFLGGLTAYRRLRTPSRRQAAIRAAVSRRIGTFADLAEWKIESLAPLFPHLEVISLDPAEMLAEAERFRTAGKYDDVLIRARLALAFAHPREEAFLVERAEVLTDECLLQLEGTDA